MNKATTIGQLRAALVAGADDETIPQALQRIEREAQAQAAYEADAAAHRAYVMLRDHRQHAALEAAARDADARSRADAGSGERMGHRTAARAEAYEAFQRDEPLLDHEAWIKAKRPEIHTLGPAARAAAAIKATIAA